MFQRQLKIEKHHQANPNVEAGFTLLEMAVTVAVGGILLAFLGTALIQFMRSAQVETTEHRLQEIHQALDRYLTVNSRYPCPANRFLGPETTGSDADFFATEVTSICDAGTFAGTVRSDGVRIGAVPTRTLNLPSEFMADAWGQKFTYAVTEALATPQQYRSDAGVITVKDGADADILTNAHYVLISHGRTGAGGYPLSASTLRRIPCPANSLDRRNCDDTDAVFRLTLVNSESNAANFYDDYVYYKGSGDTLAIPAGAVLPFSSATCPDGWSRFIWADGNFVIGESPAPVTHNQYTMRLKTPPESKTLNLSLGATDEDVESNIPPYLALTYCEKMPY